MGTVSLTTILVAADHAETFTLIDKYGRQIMVGDGPVFAALVRLVCELVDDNRKFALDELISVLYSRLDR